MLNLLLHTRSKMDYVIIQFGQSNSSGWDYNYVNNGDYNLNNPDFKIYHKPSVVALDNGSWKTFDCVTTNNNLNPINKPTQDAHGEELSLCNEITALGHKINLIKLAGGSISLCETNVFNTGWGTFYPGSVGALPYYQYLVDWYILPALAKLKKPKIIGVIMHQGESDTMNANASNAYLSNLELFWSALSSDINMSKARKYIVRVFSDWNYAVGDGLNIVRTAQENFCTDNPEFNLINIDDLANNGSHLTMAAQEIKGLRIFNDIANYI